MIFGFENYKITTLINVERYKDAAVKEKRCHAYRTNEGCFATGSGWLNNFYLSS